MQKLLYAILIGGIFTVFGGSIYMPFAMLEGLAKGEPASQVMGNIIGGLLIAWVLFSVIAYEFQKLRDDLNDIQRKEYEERQRRENQQHDAQRSDAIQDQDKPSQPPSDRQ